jgi:hypothetical protein
MKKSVLPLLLLSACAGAPPPGTVVIAPGERFTLPAPASLGREVEAVQLVTLRHGKDQIAFEGHLSVTRERVLLVGTDGFGQRLISIAWDGKTVSAEKASFLPDRLRPDSVLADVMLIYWPEAAVQAGLSGDTTQVIVQRDADPWRGQARLVNKAWDYEIDARSSVVAP